MARPLNPTELGWARYLISRGECHQHAPGVTQRCSWLEFLDHDPPCEPCGCGGCPSVAILDRDGATASGAASHVLHGGTRDMLILLHIVQDRPAYLEGASATTAPVQEFPPAPPRL